jgi:hypothetical protein
MNTLQVENLLRADCKLSDVFEGVYASDMLPAFCDTSGDGAAVVVNMDPSDRGGSHWVCMFVHKGRGEYFDSYGLAPPLEEFVNFLNRNSTSWTYNKVELQSLNTNVCGHYCIWFLSERARSRTMGEIVAGFPGDTKRNDAAVESRVVTRFGRISSQVAAAAAVAKSRKCVQCCCARVRCSV